MNIRFFTALVLTAVVIVVTPLIFQTSVRAPVATNVDSIAHVVPPSNPVEQKTASVALIAAPTTLPTRQSASAEGATVATQFSTYTTNARGAVLTSIVLDSTYRSLRPDAKGKRIELVGASGRLAEYSLLLGRDTVRLDTIAFTTERSGSATSTTQTIAYQAALPGHAVRLEYGFGRGAINSYLVQVSVSVSSAPAGSALAVQLPQTLRSNEPDTLDDVNHLAVSYRASRGDVSSVAFSKLDSTEVRLEPGPLNWVATRNKYFLVAYRSRKAPFSGLQLQGAPRAGKVATRMFGSAILPIGPDGSTSFEIYAGPQNFERLQQLGGDLDQVNPYGSSWLRPVVQPFATIVMKALLWMKRTTQLNYGWVLVLFGVIIRLVLWPLNQGAMRTSMKMQRLQPELQALQKKHSDDPKKQQEAIMKLYKEHSMSPLSPLMGCLPMLLPLTVLFALYYDFQHTIEFLGVPFLWLPDISLRDPFYITPLLMGASMYVMSWIGMRNSPPNPQAKMMSYMMPVMLTVLFLNFASGLNLYYAVQNIAALPQQWLLARERAKNPSPRPA